MVDKLNSVGRAALAAQLSQALQLKKASQHDKSHVGEREKQPETSAGHSTLDQRLARRIAAIDPDDPRRKQKAFRAFIEAKILDELGASLNNDAAFQQLVDDVVSGMESNQGLRQDIDEVTLRLLAKA